MLPRGFSGSIDYFGDMEGQDGGGRVCGVGSDVTVHTSLEEGDVAKVDFCNCALVYAADE